MEGPVWAHFMALPLPHTPTINNDLYFPKQFLLFHTSAPLYMLFFLPEMTFSSWQTLPPHRLSWRVSSSMKGTISPKADFSLLRPPQTWCPSLLTAHTAVTSMSLTGPWSFLVKWNKGMNDDGDHYDLAHYKDANTQQCGHSFWWAWYPRGYLGENPRTGGGPCLAHSRLSVNGCYIFQFWLLSKRMVARWVEGLEKTQYGHPNLSLCLLCLSGSWNLTKGKKRPFEFPFRKFSCSLRLALWEVAQACGFKASMAASHICHFLSCPKRLEGTFRSVHFFTEVFVLFSPSPSHCLSWKMLQMLGKVGQGRSFKQWLHISEASQPGIRGTTRALRLLCLGFCFQWAYLKIRPCVWK